MSLFSILNASRSAVDLFGDRLSLIGKNIASSQTPGYDRQRQLPTDSFYQQLSHASTGSASSGGGVRGAAVQTVFSMGELSPTDQPTDLAINGRGWFPVSDVDTGELRVTRIGSFDLDEDGYLQLPGGQRLMGIQGPAPAFDVTLDADNRLVYSVADSVASAAPGTEGGVLQLDWQGAGWEEGGLSFATEAPPGGRSFPLLPDGSILTATAVDGALAGLNGGLGLDFGLSYDSFAELENALSRGGLSERQVDGAIQRAAGAEGLSLGENQYRTAAEIRAALDSGEIVMPQVDEALGTGIKPAWNRYEDLLNGLQSGILSKEQIDLALTGSALNLGGQSFDGSAGSGWSALGSMLPENPATGAPYTMGDIADAAPRALGIQVREDGRVDWEFSNGTTAPAAWLRVADVRNPEALTETGEGVFALSDEAFVIGDWRTGTPGLAGRGSLVSGAIEMSNVDLTTEFADLLASQRSYQASSRMLGVMDELLGSLTQLRR